jgi:hypothetical protein
MERWEVARWVREPASAKGGGEKEENKAGALARPEVFVLWFGSI